MADEIALKLEVNGADAQKNIQATNKELSSLKDFSVKTNEASNKLTNDMKSGFDKAAPAANNMTKAQDGLGKSTASLGQGVSAVNPALGGFISGIQGITKASVAFIATPLGAIIAALVVALKAIHTAFTASEEGQDKWNKVMAVGQGIMQLVTNILEKLGNILIGFFEDPIQGFKDMGNAIKENITNRIEGMLELLPAMGKAISLAFDGEFSKAGKVATDAMAKAALGVENVTDKANSLGKEFVDLQNKSQQMADIQAEVNKLERINIVERAKNEKTVSELKLKARQADKFTAEERKGFIEEAIKLTDDVAAREEAIAQKRLKIAQIESSMGSDNIEAKKNLAELEANIFNVQKRRADLQKGIARESLAVDAELEASRKASADKEKARLESLQALRNRINDERIKAIEDEQQRELETLETAFDREIEQIKGNTELEIELRKALEERKQTELQAIRDKFKEQEDEKKRAELEQSLMDQEASLQAELIRLEMTGMSTLEKELEIERQRFDALMQLEEMTAAERELAKAEHEQNMANITKKAVDDEIAERSRVSDALLSVQQGVFGAIGALNNNFTKDQKKQIKINRDIALAQIAISTAVGVAKAVSSGAGQPYPLNIVAIATGVGAVVAGIAAAANAIGSAKKQLAGLEKNTGGSGGSGSTGSTDSQPSITPRFQSNQDRERERNLQPQRVFVTEEDIRAKTTRVNVIEESAEF